MKQLNKSRRLNSWAVLLIALILSVGNLTPALAQSDVTGKVTDEAGTAVVGATVSIVGTNQGAITDANGEFSLKATPAQKLQFSYLGYVTQTLDVGSRTRFDIVLKADSKALEEVVVVGYGVQEKSNADRRRRCRNLVGHRRHQNPAGAEHADRQTPGRARGTADLRTRQLRHELRPARIRNPDDRHRRNPER